MINGERVFRIEHIETVEELAKMLVKQTWCLCNGFSIDVDGVRLFFMNDAFSPDGAQEYACYRDGKQIETITFSWYETVEEAEATIRRCATYQPEMSFIDDGMPRIDHPDGYCDLCR